MAEEKDKLEIIISFLINSKSKYEHYDEKSPFFPMLGYFIIGKRTGYYRKNINKIARIIDILSQREILQVIYVLKKTNAYVIKNITGYSYPLIHKNLKKLNKYKLVTLKRGKSEKKKIEISVEINSNIKVNTFSESEKCLHEIFEFEINESFKQEKEYFEWVKSRIS